MQYGREGIIINWQLATVCEFVHLVVSRCFIDGSKIDTFTICNELAGIGNSGNKEKKETAFGVSVWLWLLRACMKLADCLCKQASDMKVSC